MGVTMNMLTFGYRQFVTTKKLEKLTLLKKLCEEHNPTVPPDFNLISEFAFESLMDSVKISICFENFIKGLLLANTYIIHKLDKSIFPVLYKEQFHRPITLEEIKSIGKWEVNPNVIASNEETKKQIKGITKFTLGMREILSPAYIKKLQIDPKIIELCRQYFEYRNTLHYYTKTTFSFGKQDYEEFIQLVDFINNHLVRIQNILVDEFKKGDSYKLQKISHS